MTEFHENMRTLDDIKKNMYICIIVISNVVIYGVALFIVLTYVHSLHVYGVNTVFES